MQKNEKCIHGFSIDMNCGWCAAKETYGKDFFDWNKFPNGLFEEGIKKCVDV